MTRCDAWHDGHDCRKPGACQQALTAMCNRMNNRSRDGQRERENR